MFLILINSFKCFIQAILLILIYRYTEKLNFISNKPVFFQFLLIFPPMITDTSSVCFLSFIFQFLLSSEYLQIWIEYFNVSIIPLSLGQLNNDWNTRNPAVVSYCWEWLYTVMNGIKLYLLGNCKYDNL